MAKSIFQTSKPLKLTGKMLTLDISEISEALNNFEIEDILAEAADRIKEQLDHCTSEEEKAVITDLWLRTSELADEVRFSM